MKIRIFVNSRKNYNRHGANGGAWITLPMAEDTLTQKLAEIAKAIDENPTEAEWFVNDFEADFEADFEISENENIYELNELASDLEDMDSSKAKGVIAAMKYGDDLETAIKNIRDEKYIFYQDISLINLAYEFAQELFPADAPEILLRCFDYEAYAVELSCNGYTEINGGVLCTY